MSLGTAAERTLHTPVVVLGAGVIGLTAAHVLSQDARYKVKVVARDMPDDLDSQAFASPWAGANWSPMGDGNARQHKWEKRTFDKFWDMIPSGLVMASNSKVFYGEETDLEALWYKDLPRNFRVLRPDELPAGQTRGVGFQTVSVCPTHYLPWLKAELLARGVAFERKHVPSYPAACALAGARGVLVNATALGARSLIGLEDELVYPIRGQTLVIDNPRVNEFMCTELGTEPAGDATYIIPRPWPNAHGFTTVLGGKYQPGAWDTSFSAADARGILARCAALAPAVADPATRVRAHNVGLRPARTGGPRVEAEWVDAPLAEDEDADTDMDEGRGRERGRVLVVHAYGFGGAGYQASWGVAEEVGSLVESHLTANPNDG
ncbi:nucleotide-binding domain-containing protein [Daedaleopsis nitida]|nr:nucleotide-binding domain-containing protein [Daedaleopsis nitida]